MRHVINLFLSQKWDQFFYVLKIVQEFSSGKRKESKGSYQQRANFKTRCSSGLFLSGLPVTAPLEP